MHLTWALNDIIGVMTTGNFFQLNILSIVVSSINESLWGMKNIKIFIVLSKGLAPLLAFPYAF